MLFQRIVGGFFSSDLRDFFMLKFFNPIVVVCTSFFVSNKISKSPNYSWSSLLDEVVVIN